MKKRNLIFVAAVSAAVLGVSLYAPVYRGLMNAGLVPYENVGNEITPDRVVEEGKPFAGFLNGVETAKCEVRNTYINYLPFYLTGTTGLKELKRQIDRPLQLRLQAIGDELYRQNRKNAAGK